MHGWVKLTQEIGLYCRLARIALHRKAIKAALCLLRPLT